MTSFKLLVVGGKTWDTPTRDEMRETDDVEILNPYVSNNECKQPDKYELNVKELCGVVYMFCGGSFGINYDHVSLQVYDKCYELSTEKTWKQSRYLWYPREQLACAMLGNGSIWVSGGWSDPLQKMSYASSEIFDYSLNRNLSLIHI